jgi:hypothetical protein
MDNFIKYLKDKFDKLSEEFLTLRGEFNEYYTQEKTLTEKDFSVIKKKSAF